MICPKCQHQKTEYDTEVMEGVCPKCGIAYNKWRSAQPADVIAIPLTEMELTEAATQQREHMYTGSPWHRLYRYASFMPGNRHESTFWGHTVIYVCFVIWGLRFILGGISWERVGSSFLHLVNLPFHEYGHIMFSPFGPFMMFLGGSLFQIVLPILPLMAFMVKQRENFAASIMLWWVGQNFIDVSVYIADAPYRVIPLTTGDANSHDWWNLLSMTNSLDAAGTYAMLCFLLGAAIILLSNTWGGHLLWLEFKGRTATDLNSAQ